MKTAISIPDEVFREAELTARRLGMSRSELFAKAVAAFVEIHRGRNITAALDKVYGEHGQGLDPRLAELHRRTLGKGDDTW